MFHVTFSECQIWREEERERREKEEGDLRDLSMYALHNRFLFIWERWTEHALYQKHTGSFTLTYVISHTGAGRCIYGFLPDNKKLL